MIDDCLHQEQSAEREQEREDFQRDIDRLQQQLRDKTKQGNTEDRLQMEVTVRFFSFQASVSTLETKTLLAQKSL